MQENKFELNKKELNLRISLVELIRSHVEERGITKKGVAKVVEGLTYALDDIRFEPNELFLDDLQNVNFKESDE